MAIMRFKTMIDYLMTRRGMVSSKLRNRMNRMIDQACVTYERTS